MARLLPVLLITAVAAYVVWSDSTSVEPVDPLTWMVDILIVGLAAWSWISYLTRKRPDAGQSD